MPLLLSVLSLLACSGADSDGDGIPNAYDCAPDDASVFPGNVETCDGVDNDCDGVEDEGATQIAYIDNDGDGYGSEEIVTVCELGPDEVTQGGDCADDDDSVHPDAAEICNGVDDDCDGGVDVGASDQAQWFPDFDQDGYGDADWPMDACEAPAGYIAETGDCDDADDAIHPDGVEVCDGQDNDCNGETDEDSAIDAPTWYQDTDDDGFGDEASPVVACAQPEGTSALDSDCDDTQATAFPGSDEVCDGIDNDCDGISDFDGWIPTDYADISDAAANAPAYSHICIAAGTHTVSDVEISTPGLILEGEGTASTTLDGLDENMFVLYSGSLDLRRVTVENAWSTGYQTGGVIYAYNADGIALRDVVIQGSGCASSGHCDGGVVYGQYLGEATIEDVVVDSVTSDPESQYGNSDGAILYLRADDVAINGLEITNADVTARTLGGLVFAYGETIATDIDIHDNTVQTEVIEGLVYLSGGGSRGDVTADNISMTDNDITLMYRSSSLGVYAFYSTNMWLSNITLTGNTVDQSGDITTDMTGAIYTYYNVSTHIQNVLIADNSVVLGTDLYWNGWITADEDVSVWNADVANNSVTADDMTVNAGLVRTTRALDLGNISFVGNTFSATGTLTVGGSVAYAGSGLTSSAINATDLVSGDEVDGGGTVVDTSVDPLYTDAANGDYTLGTGSPMIDAGASDVYDADGTVSDVGAYGGPLGESWL